MRSIAAKLLIAIGVVTVVFSTFILYQTYSLTNRRVREVVGREASMALKFDLAIRKYVAQHIRPLMYELVGEDDFVPEAMSTSYVARTIFEEVRHDSPDYILKFSSNNPRNPFNIAGPEELEVIEYFNNNPHIKKWEGEISINEKKYMAQFSARRMQETCLRCHGDPENAPSDLLEIYGSKAGFHRPLGEVIGLDTIAIPITKITDKLWSESIPIFLVSGLSLLLFFLIIVYATRFIITNRLIMISKHFKNAVQQEDYSNIDYIKIEGKDEVSDLALSFNMLTDKLKSFYTSLEAQVIERTKELADKNEQLEHEIEDRKKAEKALLKSRERLEDILHSLPVGIIIIDPETHKIVDVNSVAVLKIGAPSEQIVGSICHDFICSKEKGKCPITDLGKTIDNRECVMIDVQGDYIPILKTVIPVEIDGQKLFIECFVDISDHKRAEQDRLEKEKLQGVIEMAGAVCHELNQPLQAVSGYSELLMMEIKDDNSLYDKSHKIKKQVERMGTITQKLSGITRYETMDYLEGKIIDIDKATG